MNFRTFIQHEIRRTGSLDGIWQAWPELSDSGACPSGAPASAVPLVTPGVWEAQPGWERYRGLMWYERNIDLPAGSLRMVFAGVSHSARVYLDGELLGEHDDAYTPFAVETYLSTAGSHRLTLRIDNRFGQHASLHVENDYYTYGGITRPAEWQALSDAFLVRSKIIPRSVSGRWTLDLEAVVRSTRDVEQVLTLNLEAFGQNLELKADLRLKPNEQRSVHATIDVPEGADEWSAEAPNLHTATLSLIGENQRPIDDLVERIGLRTVRVEGDRLLLNEQPISLRGFNRHEDHPQFGCALPVSAMAYDLALMRDCGANAVRTSHYPNDQRFLDLCDELGMLVWEESHARSVSFDHPTYRVQIDRSTTEMVQAHANHPSVVIWGCLNECETRTQAGADEHGRVLNLLRELDDSRPVTYASMYHEQDLAYGHTDIVSWNRYDNWYIREPVAEKLKGVMDWLHADPATGGQGKPVILSEFGAGAIYGYRKATCDRWTEEYQAEALAECLDAYLDQSGVIGAFIWQFCDVRVTEGGGTQHGPWSTRPRTMNNKGVFDEYRRPKLSKQTVIEKMRIK